MGGQKQAWYLDTSVLIPLLDRRGIIETERGVTRAAREFFNKKVVRYPNIIVKIHFLAVAELVNKIMRKSLDSEDARVIFDSFFEIKDRLGERLQLCPVKQLERFILTLQRFIKGYRQLTGEPADAMILVTATLDPEATKLYTRDQKLLLSDQVRRLVAETRQLEGMDDLRIENPLEH